MPHKPYKRSRADYPMGVIGIYDNAGQSNESADHYTVVFEPIEDDYHWGHGLEYPILTMSGEPFHPQGVCMHGSVRFRPTGGWQSGPNSAGKTINFADLPDDCRRAVLQDLMPLCSDCMGFLGDHYPNCTAPLPYTVGEADAKAGATGRVLGRFETEALAAAFIQTLPDYLSGRYYLDGPEGDN